MYHLSKLETILVVTWKLFEGDLTFVSHHPHNRFKPIHIVRIKNNIVLFLIPINEITIHIERNLNLTMFKKTVNFRSGRLKTLTNALKESFKVQRTNKIKAI
jgi:hypothetical protein